MAGAEGRRGSSSSNSSGYQHHHVGQRELLFSRPGWPGTRPIHQRFRDRSGLSACLTRQRISLSSHAQVDQPVGEVFGTLVATSWLAGVLEAPARQPLPSLGEWPCADEAIRFAAPANPACWGPQQAHWQSREQGGFAAAVFRQSSHSGAPFRECARLNWPNGWRQRTGNTDNPTASNSSNGVSLDGLAALHGCCSHGCSGKAEALSSTRIQPQASALRRLGRRRKSLTRESRATRSGSPGGQAHGTRSD